MISPGIEIRWQGMQKGRKGKIRDRLKLWSPSALKKMRPLLTIATTVTMKIKERVMVRGIDSNGSRYMPLGERARLAIPPWYPQPRAPGRFRFHGKLNPYAFYDNRAVYNKARKLPPFRNFFMSGGMWKSLQAKAVGPGYVRVMFAGSSPRYKARHSFFEKQRGAAKTGGKMPSKDSMQNRKKASGAARTSGKDILSFNRDELREYMKLMTAYCNAYVFLPEWQKSEYQGMAEDRRGFKIKTLEAKIQAARGRARRKMNKVMSKAGSNTKFAPSQQGSNENVK